MIIKRYRPNYFSGFEGDYIINPGCFEDCLNIDWIKCWQEMPNFYKFSQSHSEYLDKGNSNHIYRLMCELDNGFKWWVVALCEQPFWQLPEWQPKYN